ncbi:MAG: hypothetical protein QW650_00275 [Thermofilum sp.]
MPSIRLPKVPKPHLSEKALSKRLMKALTGGAAAKDFEELFEVAKKVKPPSPPSPPPKPSLPKGRVDIMALKAKDTRAISREIARSLSTNREFAEAFTAEFKRQLKPLLKTVTKEEKKELKRFLKDLEKWRASLKNVQPPELSPTTQKLWLELQQTPQTLAQQHVQEMLNLPPQRKSLLGKALPYILSAGAGAAVTGGVMMALQSEQNDQVPFQYYQ